MHDVDAEVETTASEETTAVGQIDDIADEKSRKSLRDQLRRTLSKREHPGLCLPVLHISASKHVPEPHLRKSIASVITEVTTTVGLSFKSIVDFLSP